jgi:hypothetical protein
MPSGSVAMAATKAAIPLARFQNIPIKNMATTPGDIKPLNSWIN